MADVRRARKRRLGNTDPPDPSTLEVPKRVANSASKRSRTDAGGRLPLASWTNAQIVDYLKGKHFDKVTCDAFRDHNITGWELTHVDGAALRRMGITAVETQLDLCKLFQGVDSSPFLDEKIFNDPIHGHIELHPLLLKIIDTPQFQRLRRIKQLGGAYYVFPGASHNRFEHSIGVGHLAREFVENLQRRQPELGITAVDCLCVSIAGLCHDLGHGPFSHMFDNIFMKKAQGGKLSGWKHEQGSVDMFDHLMEENKLWPEFERYGLNEDDVVFIKEMILGPEATCIGSGCQNDDMNDTSSPVPWKYRGRPVEKSFLYEIVANKRNGIDVDKWDYFARDCHCLGIPNNFDQRRYVKFARVIEVDGVRQICCRDKEVNNLYEMFHTRTGLHRRAYQHKTSKCVELMVSEALLAADEYFSLPGKEGNPVKISGSVKDMQAFTRLHDGVLDQIMVSQNPQLDKAKELLGLVERRQLYKYIGQTQPSEELEFDKDEILQEIVDAMDRDELNAKNLPKLLPSDLLVEQVTFDYGMKEKNPIDLMRFYTKERPDRAFKIRKDQVSQFLPHIFIEKHIRVYSRSRQPLKVEAAQKCFRKWCWQQGNNKGEFSSDEEDNWTPYGTPMKDSTRSDQQQTSRDVKKRRLTYSES